MSFTTTPKNTKRCLALEPMDEQLKADCLKAKKQNKTKILNAQWALELFTSISVSFHSCCKFPSSLAQVLCKVVSLPGRCDWKGAKTCSVNWKINMSGRINATRPLWRPPGKSQRCSVGGMGHWKFTWRPESERRGEKLYKLSGGASDPPFLPFRLGIGRICSTVVSVKTEKSFSHPQQKKTIFFFEEFGWSFPWGCLQTIWVPSPTFPPKSLASHPPLVLPTAPFCLFA